MYSHAVINHFLYGPRDEGQGGRLREELHRTPLFERAAAYDAAYWRQLLQHWLVDAPRVAVQCRPSRGASERNQQQERERVQKVCGGGGGVGGAGACGRGASMWRAAAGEPPPAAGGAVLIEGGRSLS